MAPRKPIAPDDRSTLPQQSAADLRYSKVTKDRGSDKAVMNRALEDTKYAVRNADLNTVDNVTPSKSHPIPSYKKGGKVRKTGLALLHKGEKVIPKHKVARKRG